MFLGLFYFMFLHRQATIKVVRMQTDLALCFDFSASSQAIARLSNSILCVSSASRLFLLFSSSSLLAQAAMFIFPNRTPRVTISLLVFAFISSSDSSLFVFADRSCDSACWPPLGVEGRDEVGLRRGVVAPNGVTDLDGS